MEQWRKVWREGIAPQFSGRALRSLLEAVRRDDPRLRQSVLAVGVITPVQVCAIGWLLEADDGLTTIYEIEHGFQLSGNICSSLCGRYPSAFLSWFDDTPRPEMRRELAWEIELALMVRQAAADDSRATAVDALVPQERRIAEELLV